MVRIHLTSGGHIDIGVICDIDEIYAELGEYEGLDSTTFAKFGNAILPLDKVAGIENIEPSAQCPIGWHSMQHSCPPDMKQMYLVQYDDGTLESIMWTDASLVNSEPTGNYHWSGSKQYKEVVAWAEMPMRYLNSNNEQIL